MHVPCIARVDWWGRYPLTKEDDMLKDPDHLHCRRCTKTWEVPTGYALAVQADAIAHVRLRHPDADWQDLVDRGRFADNSIWNTWGAAQNDTTREG